MCTSTVTPLLLAQLTKFPTLSLKPDHGSLHYYSIKKGKLTVPTLNPEELRYQHLHCISPDNFLLSSVTLCAWDFRHDEKIAYKLKFPLRIIHDQDLRKMKNIFMLKYEIFRHLAHN